MSERADPPIHLAVDTSDVRAGLLVVPVFEGGDDLDGLACLDEPTRSALGRALAAREITGAPYEQWWGPAAAGAPGAARVMALGAGPRPRWSLEAARRWASAAALLARQRRIGELALLCHEAPGGPARSVQAFVEGAMLAQHDVGHLKTTPPDLGRLARLTVIGRVPDEAMRASVRRGQVLAACTNLARALGNEPANVLTPREMARRAEAAAAGTGLTVTVLDEAAMAGLGMGLLLGVAQGSAEPPRLIVIEHTPAGAAERPVLGLVGKGVTFDSGGISIKPAEGMDRMKVDMAGGAAVIGALRAASLLDAPVRVVGVVACTENMPGGRALKPGDVIRGAAGKTVEVINTDGEGRLVLGDALWYARQRGATHLVDVATLTGACVIALGRVMAGAFGEPARFADAVRAAGELSGDRCWPMPSADEYFEQLRSDVADMTNTGGRPAGAVTAAVFLKQFAGGLPWAHLDIAGVAWADDARPYQAKGATGAATRLLAELALDPAAWAG